MASLEDLEDLEHEQQERKKDEDKKKEEEGGDGDSKMDVDGEDKKEEDEDIDPDILSAATTDIINRRRLMENDLRVMRQEFQRLTHEKASMKDKIKDNLEKIENNRYAAAELLGSCLPPQANSSCSPPQTAPLPGRKRRRAAGPRPHRRGGGWRQRRPRRRSLRKVCGHQDFDPADNLPSFDWSCRRR